MPAPAAPEGPRVHARANPAQQAALSHAPGAHDALPEVSQSEAALLLVLARGGEASTRDLVHALSLPQPRVSNITRDLLERGWIAYRVDKRAVAGRPRHIYRLRKGLDALLEDLRKRETMRHERNVAAIEAVLRAARQAAARGDEDLLDDDAVQ